ncbi:hypothetical protein GDO81_001017 [Engystomops pustulosus]|uniref:Uncharacterized protein n=1 Tax=Engystomops pustulosus TaxID=76066 RepID=A0AAV7DD15_ENGPU|nr:hypothetical protein GDO81_001017 [Engystomops pustulosus]
MQKLSLLYLATRDINFKPAPLKDKNFFFIYRKKKKKKISSSCCHDYSKYLNTCPEQLKNYNFCLFRTFVTRQVEKCALHVLGGEFNTLNLNFPVSAGAHHPN